MQKEFERHMNSLEKVFDFVHSFIEVEQLNQELQSQLNLVIEELFSNMVKYNSENPKKIRLKLSKESDLLTIELTDFDVEHFDIRKFGDYDPHQILDKRPIGKVGLHLVKKYVDDIDYEYKNRVSKITLYKYVKDKYV